MPGSSQRRSPLFLLTVNKKDRPPSEYNRDVLTLLALPVGALFRFRYHLRYVDRAIGIAANVRPLPVNRPISLSEAEAEQIETELKNRKAWLVLYDEFTKTYLPLRRVFTTRAEVKGEFVRIIFYVDHFAEYHAVEGEPETEPSTRYREYIEPVHTSSSANVFNQPYRSGGHALVLEGENLPDTIADSPEDDWQRVVKQLRRVEHYAGYTYIAVLRVYRSGVQEETVPMGETGIYCLPSNDSYVLELQHFRDTKLPETDAKENEPPKPPTARVTAFADHVVALPSEVKLNGRYDVSPIRFSVKKRLNDVQSYIGIRSDDAGLPEFELPLLLQTRYDGADWVTGVAMCVVIALHAMFAVYASTLGVKEFFIALATFMVSTLALVQRFTRKESG